MVPEHEADRERAQPRSAPPDVSESEEDIEHFKQTVLNKLALVVGKDASGATDRDWFVATTLSLRDRVIHRWLEGERDTLARGRKRIYYLSRESLIGRLLNDVTRPLPITPTAP